jgi:hypothetical protein
MITTYLIKCKYFTTVLWDTCTCLPAPGFLTVVKHVSNFRVVNMPKSAKQSFHYVDPVLQQKKNNKKCKKAKPKKKKRNSDVKIQPSLETRIMYKIADSAPTSTKYLQSASRNLDKLEERRKMRAAGPPIYRTFNLVKYT